jgi:hypothetical protein
MLNGIFIVQNGKEKNKVAKEDLKDGNIILD